MVEVTGVYKCGDWWACTLSGREDRLKKTEAYCFITERMHGLPEEIRGKWILEVRNNECPDELAAFTWAQKIIQENIDG